MNNLEERAVIKTIQKAICWAHGFDPKVVLRIPPDVTQHKGRVHVPYDAVRADTKALLLLASHLRYDPSTNPLRKWWVNKTGNGIFYTEPRLIYKLTNIEFASNWQEAQEIAQSLPHLSFSDKSNTYFFECHLLRQGKKYRIRQST